MFPIQSGTDDEKLWVDDVFSTYLYTGNGSTQTITNGIDLAGKGGLVWVKGRSSATTHLLQDSEQGFNKYLQSNAVSASVTGNYVTANSSGFSWAGSAFGDNGITLASWTFRKAPKFFTHTTVSHTNGAPTNIGLSSLETVGQAAAKITSTTGDWIVWHRSLTAGNNLRLNTTAAQTATDAWLSVSGTTATLSGSAPTGTYVIYGWAHDTGTDGIIQCGSFTTDASGNATVNHGWNAGVQFAKIKAPSTSGDWEMYDTARTSGWSGNDARLRANLSNSEDAVTRLSASGTSVSFTGLSASSTYIYVFVVAPT